MINELTVTSEEDFSYLKALSGSFLQMLVSMVCICKNQWPGHLYDLSLGTLLNEKNINEDLCHSHFSKIIFNVPQGFLTIINKLK